MTRAVENAGVLVTRCSTSDKVDAFSRSASGRKVIIVNESKGATRTRWDIAHELGHLVLHGGMVTGDEETERQANRFASAFLMPPASFAREFPRMARIEWEALFRLKDRWGTSLAAIIRTAKDLSLLSAVHYTSAYKYISWNGWTKNEPREPPLEQPESVREALEILENDGGAVADAAVDLFMTEEVFLDVTGNVYKPQPRPPKPELDGRSGKVLPFDASRRARRVA
jgi:Zn-dependent peptidase ImmA (M78 family)